MIDKLPEPLAKAVKATLEDWKSSNKVQGLWARDASLWTNADEGKWLGWLGIADEQIIPVPGQKYTFGIVKAGQARGDFQVLAEPNRRALRVHLGPDVAAGLNQLQRAIQQALA